MAANDKKTSPDKRYVRGAFIAKGAFKRVYQALDEEEGLEVAWNEATLESVMDNEVGLLTSLRHPHVVSILESWDDKPRGVRVFITELLASGSLRTYIKRISQKKLSEKVISSWGRQILDGLVYLHKNKIIHRDLKCDNIFINGNKGELKIGDFGLSCVMSTAAGSVIGTPEFMAPEIYDEHYTEKVDVYSFGMCMLEMATGAYPYSECENCGQVFKRVTSGMPPNSLRSLPESTLKAAIVSCLKPAADRPSALELLSNPFFSSDNSPDNDQNTNMAKINGKIEKDPLPKDQQAKPSGGSSDSTTSGSAPSLLLASEKQDLEIEKALSLYGDLGKQQLPPIAAVDEEGPDPLGHIEFSPRGSENKEGRTFASKGSSDDCQSERWGSGKMSSEKLQAAAGEGNGYSQKLSTLTANHVKILQKMSDLISKVE